MPNDVIREPFEGVIGPVVVDAGAGAVGPLEREDPVVARVVKDDFFVRKSVWISTDVWMGPETEVGWDRKLGLD